jgi:hypothetical protein
MRLEASFPLVQQSKCCGQLRRYGPVVGNGALGVRAKPRYSWLAATATAAIAAFGVSSCSSGQRSTEKQVAAAENDVYEAVVHDIVRTSKESGELVFNQTLLTEFPSAVESRSCQESVRKNVPLEDYTPPYNSLADRVFRFVDRSYDDSYSLRADTIRNFVAKVCKSGRLSQTFHTDLPKTFIAIGSTHFKDLNVNDGSKAFEQLFPRARGIISLSHVGFDSTLREAIVLTSFECGVLCGSGQCYSLRNIRGHWEVVSKWIVWEE